MSIDPQLRRKQDEWADVISKVELKDYVDEGSSVLANVSEKYKLGALWLMDAISARSVDFPQNDREFYYYRISRSGTLRLVYNLACIAQVILPFFAVPECAFVVGIKKLSKYIIVDVVCLLIYLFDMALVFNVDSTNKRLIKKPWSAFRLFCCFLLFLECIAFSSAEFAGVRLVRSVFPLFLISRRTNLQKIMQGLMASAIKSLTVVTALFCVIILWSFVGFLVFRDLDPDDGGLQRYNTYYDAMFATLHCFTSRPFCLMALKPYFQLNEAAAVFFVTLTVAADIICISLIVGIGSSEYKLFAASYVKNRIEGRAYTSRLVFDAFCNKDKLLDRSTWCRLCVSMNSKFHRSKGEAVIMFSLEDDQDTGFIDYLSFVRLCALIAQRVVIMVPDNLRIEGDTRSGMPTDLGEALMNTEATRSEASRSSLILASVGNSNSEVLRSSSDSISYSNANHPPLISKKYRRYHLVSLFGESQTASKLVVNMSNNCYIILSASISIKFWADQIFTVSVRDLVMCIVYLLLVVYLVEISAVGCAAGWFSLGFVLEAIFWLDMIIHIGAFGWAEYTSRILNCFAVIINLSTFVSMVVQAHHHQSGNIKGGPLLATIVTQSLRMIFPFFAVNDVAIFERILPILIRAGFVYFSFIYFYAIFAHNFFCGDLDTNLAAEGDDDSTTWVTYASILNFNTYLQAVFTMFEMSILGNWSIVMDAAAKKAKTRAYVFFYSFRLLVTLNVLPLLIGFVMQAFVGARKEIANKQLGEVNTLLTPQTVEAAEVDNSARQTSSDSRRSNNPDGYSEASTAGVNLTTFRSSLTQQNEDRNSSNTAYRPPSPVDLSPGGGDRKKISSFQPGVSLSAPKRSDPSATYAVSGSRAHNSTRLSLWNADGGSSPATSPPTNLGRDQSIMRASSVAAPLPSQPNSFQDFEKDVIIKDLQQQLTSALEELRRTKSSAAVNDNIE
jgi:hypothetical protein